MKNYERINKDFSEYKVNNFIPKISNDIQLTFVEKGIYIIKNKELNRYLKISKELFNLISLINNKRTIYEIVEIYNNDNVEILNSKFVHQMFCIKFADFGLLENNENLKKNGKPNYLKLSTILINETKLNIITKYFFFLFNLKTAITILLISFSLFIYWIENYFETYVNYNFQNCILLSFSLVFFSTIFHEIGHATSSRFFGAKHNGIGVGFYLFYPVFYADVTDIWNLSKIKRIIVNLAGIYFEILFSTILLLLSFILKQELLGFIALFIFLKTFLNLNPLIRSDGYWILSDSIGKPNLMKHGFFAIKHIFKDKTHWKSMDYFVLIYGVISYLFILFFIYIVFIRNPNSILHFPENIKIFIQNIFTQDYQISFNELKKIILPILFFYFLFGILKNLGEKLKSKIELKHKKQ